MKVRFAALTMAMAVLVQTGSAQQPPGPAAEPRRRRCGRLKSIPIAA